MMEIVLMHKHFDEQHLAKVMGEMRTLGAPVIRAVHLEGNLWVALEGCHRLRAAEKLGLVPVLEEVEYSDTITAFDLGLDFQENYTISELVDGYYSRPSIRFED
jgi:hypothetical protein